MFALQSVASSPVPLTGLRLWLKPESIAYPNGTVISNWIDSSGLRNDGTNVIAFSPYATNSLNGYQSAYFAGGGSIGLTFRTNQGVSMLRNVPGATLYIIQTPYTGGGSYAFFVKDSGGSKLRLGPNISGSNIRFIGKSLDGDADQIGNFGNIPNVANHFFLVNMVVSYTGRTWSMYTNGVLSITQGSMGWTASNTSDTDSGITDPNTLGRVNYVGKIAEVLLYGTNHSSTDRLMVEKYLTNKYGTFPTW